jgi:hypothetical protein
LPITGDGSPHRLYRFLGLGTVHIRDSVRLAAKSHRRHWPSKASEDVQDRRTPNPLGDAVTASATGIALSRSNNMNKQGQREIVCPECQGEQMITKAGVRRPPKLGGEAKSSVRTLTRTVLKTLGSGAGEVRTRDNRFRKPMLYPSELQPLGE